MRILCLLLVVVLLSGCGYYSSNLIRVKADVAKGQIGSYTPVVGEGVNSMVLRQMLWGTTDFVEAIKESVMSDVAITESSKNTGSTIIRKPVMLSSEVTDVD